MNKIIFTTLFFTISFIFHSQEVKEISTIKKNTIFLEAGGQSLFYSLNYDRLFRIHKKIQNSFECGFSILPHYKYLDFDYIISTPISCNFLIGKSNNKLEIGIGLTAMFIGNYWTSNPDMHDSYSNHEINYYEENTRSIDFSPKLGYRFQKAEGGFFFRATLTPMLPLGHSSVKKELNFDEYPIHHFNDKISSFTTRDFYYWMGISLGWTFKGSKPAKPISEYVTLKKKNTIYVEALGQGIVNSINYDRIVRSEKKVKNSISVGFGAKILNVTDTRLSTHISYNFLFGTKANKLELGLGVNAMYLEDEYDFIEYNYSYPAQKGPVYRKGLYTYASPKIGYRYQKSGGGLFLRATFTPLITLRNKIDIVYSGNKEPESFENKTLIPLFKRKNITPWVGFSVGYTF